MDLSATLLAWYDDHARDLPWRARPYDPYRTWVSEIMLQQTRVDTVLRYYDRFLSAFPTVEVLATVGDDELLVQWEGLGYYRRARNLRDGAQVVVDRWLGEKGRWPRTVEEWISVPGVGRYTAAAIASIVFDQRAAVVDGNVKRVLARVFAIEAEVNTTAGEKEVQARADELIPADRPGDHNQAVMELGAVVCTPRSPVCSECPWRNACRALKHQRVAELPRLKAKKAVPHKREAVAVIRREGDGALLIRRRPADGMLGGLWELPGVFVDAGEDLAEALTRALPGLLPASSRDDAVNETWSPERRTGDDREDGPGMNTGGRKNAPVARVGRVMATAKHAYSHFTLACTAFEVALRCQLVEPLPEGWRWLTPANRGEVALHRAHDKVLEELAGDQGRLPLE